MTTGPTDEESTTAAGGPGGMPLALRLSEVLGPHAVTNINPCPFCGAVEALRMITLAELAGQCHEKWEWGESWGVVCSTIGPNGPMGCGASAGFMPSKNEAARAWNMRA